MTQGINPLPDDLPDRVAKAVAQFWRARAEQADKQRESRAPDQGARGAVTGGAQMDGFISLIGSLITWSGVPEESVYTKKRFLELPGFFRPTKEWDILVVSEARLVAAIEAKSHVGPSFGNNFNNRTEEAMGSALDLWTAFREKAFGEGADAPWLGYVFLLEDCKASQTAVKVREPHFEVFEEFKQASYATRYQLFCRKLKRERLYNAAAFLMTNRETGSHGDYREPAKDLTFADFVQSMLAHMRGHT